MQVNPLYGQTGEGSRFAVAGDPRRMYPVGAAGGLRSIEHLPHQMQSGSLFSYYVGSGSPVGIAKQDVFGCQNLISNGSALYGVGSVADINSQTYAIRLGVTGASGGNDTLTNPVGHGFIHTNLTYDQDIERTFMFNGEAIVRDTNAGTPVYGASNEPFTLNVGGTVTTTAGSGLIQGNGTTFTTASIGGAASQYNGIYIGNTPSDDVLRAGDVIRVQNTAGTLFTYHRIINVNAAAGAAALVVSPVVPNAGVAQPYTLIRTGWTALWRSRVVSIRRLGTYYNYYASGRYAGSDLFFSTGGISCFTRDAVASTNSTHYTSPKTTSGGANIADVRAIDIAYYKGFMLYLAPGGAIGWSVAGFPTSTTVGFGATDFPAGNVSVVALGDNGITFEYIGDQLIAIFQNSIWQVEATGTVPEFNFFRLPEPTGCFLNSQVGQAGGFASSGEGCYRPSATARSSVFYWSNQGLMQLSGGTATNVSSDIYSLLQAQFKDESPQIMWEPTTDTVFVTGSAGTSRMQGFMYNVPTQTWSYLNGDALAVASSPVLIGFTGDAKSVAQQMNAGFYDTTLERIRWLDQISGGPFLPGSVFTATCIWGSPVVSLGDEYGGFPVAGIQVEGSVGTAATFDIWEGNAPYTMNKSATGIPVRFLDNRNLLGKKLDSAFMASVINIGNSNSRPVLGGINLYPEGRGK